LSALPQRYECSLQLVTLRSRVTYNAGFGRTRVSALHNRMFKGTVESIFIATAARAAMQAVNHARMIPGVGVEGDRYALRQGTFFKELPDFELTLIEAEAIESLKREYGVELVPGDARRNVVTRGVPLNHLVGKEFTIGEVRIKGIRLCEPCTHLEAVTKLSLIKGLRHRGGLRAQILSEGTIAIGDVIGDS
jgi:MOSC domain-containing protein YiiM